VKALFNSLYDFGTRYRIQLTLVAGAMVCLWGLGREGLWEPWEMDRAALARSFVEPSKVPIALGTAQGPLQDAVLKAADGAGVVLRFATPPRAGSRGIAAGARTLQEAVTTTRNEVVGAVMLDIALLADDPMKPDSWDASGGRLLDATRYAPNAHVILMGVPKEGANWSADTIATNARRAAVRAQLQSTVRDYRMTDALDVKKGGPQVDQAIEAGMQQGVVGDNIRVVLGTDQGALQSAIEDSAAVGAYTVRFKLNGATHTVAPLETWLTAISYNLFDTTEFSTRLPGALLALLTLVILVLVSRRVWSDRVAVLAGLVCATTPLFFAQARSATGETGAMLGLAMVAAALLLHAKLLSEAASTKAAEMGSTSDTRDVRNMWVLFAGGLLVGFLSKGLFALLTYAVMTGGLVLITADRDRNSLKLVGLSVGVLALAAAWVMNSPTDGFSGMFGLSEAIFSTGPTDYTRNFDLVIHQIGFGTFPWAPMLVLVFGSVIIYGAKMQDRKVMIAVLWFAIPVVLMMLMLKNYNQFLWPAAPAGALAIALAFNHIWEKPFSSHLASLLLFAMFVILLNELGDSPQPLAGFLTFDPPFAKKGAQRFPETLQLASMIKLSGFLLLVVAMAYFSRLSDLVLRVLTFFRNPLPYWIALLEILAAFATLGLTVRMLLSYSSAMGTPAAAALAPHQRTFASRYLFGADPVVLALWAVGIGLLLVAIVRWIPAWSRRYKGAPAEEAYKATWLAKLAADKPPLQKQALLATAGAWVALGVSMMFSVDTPPDYYGDILGGGSLLVLALAAAGGFAWVRFAIGEDVRTAAIFAVGVLGLFLGANYMRDAMHYPWYAVVFGGLGALSLFASILPSAWRSGVAYYRVGMTLRVALGVAVAMPLIARYDAMQPILAPTAGETQVEYILTKSRLTVLTIIAALGLIANQYLMPRLAAWAEQRKTPEGVTLSERVVNLVRLNQRGPVTVSLLVLLSLVVTTGAIASFYPSLSYNVSQKHIVDTYRTAEGLTGSNTLGPNIFKHGSFATAGRSDANFYTASIPEVRDRNQALSVLLGQKDMGLQVETAGGTSVVPIQGWINDVAQTRQYEGMVGLATSVEPGKLIDGQAKWRPGEHKGKLLIDSKGKQFTIAGNDATSLQLEGGGTPYFSAMRRQDTFYAIDDPNASNHGATAKAPLRYYFLLPADGLSGVNHAFRKLSGGRHIPVIDGRSYRVLLAASWLGKDEENQNRYAKHTLTRQEFDKLNKPGMMKAKPGSYLTNFEDSIHIVGFSTSTPLVSRGQEFEVTVYYQSIKEVRTSYQIFMHIDKRGTSNRIHSDHWPLNLTEGGEDDKACTGCYRTDHWLPGDVIVDTFRKKVPAGNPSGIQDVWVGLFRPSGGARMKVKDWDKGQISHDGGNRVRLGYFTVR